MSGYKIATAEASPNIALIKYWGKRDEKLFLPLNGSLSVTLDAPIKTRTTVLFSDQLKKDEFWLNERRQTEEESADVVRVLNLLRSDETQLRALVVSFNSFPSSAGLASSASGIAALTVGGAHALNLKLDPQALSIIARQGSGSACRSIMGGFVEWTKGANQDGRDSYAVQIEPHTFWPEIRILIAIVTSQKKEVSSRVGQTRTVKTSSLFPQRLKEMDKHLSAVKEMIARKDIEKLFLEVMRESNNLHAVMMDSWPPFFYLNDVSRNIIRAVMEFNSGSIKAAYTFDAGPNAFIITTVDYANELNNQISRISGVEEVLESKVGQGPKILQDDSSHLIDVKAMTPVSFSPKQAM